MIEPCAKPGEITWYLAQSLDLAQIHASLESRGGRLRDLRARQRALRLQHAEDRARLGLPAVREEPPTGGLHITIRADFAGWLIGLTGTSEERDCLDGILGPRHNAPSNPDPHGHLTWTLHDSDRGCSPVPLRERVEAALAALVDRAARRGAFGPEHDPWLAAQWCASPAGQATLGKVRLTVSEILSRGEKVPAESVEIRAIARGPHLPRRTLAERLRISPVAHEGRVDAIGDWGGPRRILAQTAERDRRLFISEGHHRSQPRKRGSGYTPASLWIQGDAAGDLFARNVVIYRGRVSREILMDLAPRIEAGLGCPGIGAFLALTHTLTIDPEF